MRNIYLFITEPPSSVKGYAVVQLVEEVSGSIPDGVVGIFQ
jgi:hypothetical protein